MFIDLADIKVKAGNGGDGAVSFHREKYVAAGGPDGGDGGKGGDVVFIADDNLSTLADFRYKRKYVAENGENGKAKRQSGKYGKDTVLRVPRGTLIREKQSKRIVADISSDEPVIIAKGGRGGFGNSHFATPTRQVPRFSKPGIPGEEMELQLELKLLADVGLVGFPNVGKSTLISVISEAKPKIANYHFTTLTPVLGVVRVSEEHSFVVADIPGLIEGASDGVGLGHEFLRHVERCRLIVHVVDVSSIEGRDPCEDFDTINSELRKFSAELADRPQIAAANKADIASEEQIKAFKEFIECKGFPFYTISAASHQGVEELVLAISAELSKLPPVKIYEPEQRLPDELDVDRSGFTIRVEDGVYIVDAPWLARSLLHVNMDDYESLQYFQRLLHSSGIIDKLREMGVHEGDTVSIFDFEFDYIE